MLNSKPPAIIFGPAPITGLGVARNLGKNGIKVYCVAEQKNEIAYSIYCKGFYAIPRIEKDKHVLREFLSSVKKDLQQAVIFPCSDLFCLSLSQLKEEANSVLEEYHVTFGASKTIETLVNKGKFYRSLEKYGVPHPTTYFLKSPEDIEDISRRVQYPAFIKPTITQLFARFQRKGLIARSPAELKHFLRLVSRHDIKVIVQEIIPGPATSMFGIAGYFNKNSKPKAFFAYHRLREYPLGFGNGCLIESIPLSAVSSMKETVENYLKKLDYHGVFDAEFKKDRRDGSFKLLEINARSWWQNSFPAKCGLNVILMAYLDAVGVKTDYTENYRTGVKWLFSINDAISSFEMFHRNEINLYQWLLSFKGIKDFAYFSAVDPLPWISSFLYIPQGYARLLHAKAFTRLYEIILKGSDKNRLNSLHNSDNQ